MAFPTILMIAPSPPLPDSGGGIALFGNLYELNRRGATVDLICFRANRPAKGLEQLKALCRHLILVEGPPALSLSAVTDAILKQRPLVVARHHSPLMRQAITGQLATYAYDMVLVAFSFMFQYLLQPEIVFASPKKPLLALDHLVVTPKVYEYFVHVARQPLVKWFRRYEIMRLNPYLQQILVAADKHFFVGQEDLDYVQRTFPTVNRKNLVYRPAGLILERYPVANPAQTQPDTLGFFGAFNWAANVDAVHYFVAEILPLIQRERPQVKLILAGRSAPRSIQALAGHPGVEFMGEVEEMFPLAQRVAVMVAPLRIGAGTRLKILEALAWGKPVVATSVGVEGIECAPGQELLLADQPELFARTVIELLDNPLKQQRLSQAGRKRIESTYSVQQSVDCLLEALEATASPVRQKGG